MALVLMNEGLLPALRVAAGYTLLSPTILTVFCLLALPIFTLVTYIFWSQTYVHIDQAFTLKNYETFFDK